MISEHRKNYLKNWKEKNKEKIKLYQKEYHFKNWRNYYKPKTTNGGLHSIGRKFESIATVLLKGSENLNSAKQCNDFDLMWRHKNVEVKARNSGGKYKIWRFSIRNKRVADYYLLFCLDDGKINKILLLPKSSFKRDMNIGRNSKYNKYILS